MMVGDMVNEEQKSLAYSIQSFLCNAGSLVGYIFPFVLTGIGISNISPEGGLAPEINMLVLAGVLLIAGACCVFIIKGKSDEE